MTVDLPVVPEAAVEAGWAAIRTECFHVWRAPWGDDCWQDAPAGWTPPGEDAR